MKTKILKLIVIMVLAAMPSIMIYAQGAKPSIPADVQKLKIFMGNWKGTMVINSSKGESQEVASINFHSVAGGYGLYAEESMHDPAMGEMKGVDIFGYDPYEGKLHCFTVDNTGTAHDHLCTWKSDQYLYMEHNSVRDGKPYMEKINCQMTAKGAMDFKIEVYLDGKLSESMAGVYNRVKD